MTTPARPASGSGILSFERVSFAVEDGRELLRSADLEVAPASLSVLAGPSGAGKTTLLRLGNRLAVPTAGCVRFRGVESSEIDPQELRRQVGMVFQRPVSFPGSVRDNLRVAVPEVAESECEAVLLRVGLDPSMLDRTADELSGGEAQRMCLARTLLTEPSVILMDEPTSSLDPESRTGIECLTRELATEGIGILWVSHDLAQIHRIADFVSVLIDGRNATAQETADYLHSREDQ